MERMGAEGLSHGQLNERAIFDLVVDVQPGGQEAITRGVELGMLGEADKHQGAWEFAVFRNRFVKEGGLWKLKELRVTPLLHADYAKGWGDGGTDAAAAADRAAPPFLGVTPAGLRRASAAPLTGPVKAAPVAPNTDLADLSRRLSRSQAYDGVEDVSAAYGFYIDDFQWPQMAAIFAVKGNKQSPFVGYYLGRERILGVVNATWGPAAPMREAISFHWRTQPVILVAADGRSANARFRLFQPRTGKTVGKPGDFYGAAFWGGIYHDQMVLERGIWRFWNLSLDEPYINPVGWKGGWAMAEDPAEPPSGPASPLLGTYPPDVPITALGKREEHFRGGTGTPLQWPSILPMWFEYRNPVSGRVPEHYDRYCVPCEAAPQLRLDRNGYMLPPTGPAPEPQK
jgi:hypothetical protein